MRTNIDIDDELITAAMEFGPTTKTAAVEEALKLFVRMKRQAEILELVDPGTFWPGYDPESGEDGPPDDRAR